MPEASILTKLSAVEAVAAMRNGEITAEAYANALLTRAEQLAHLNTFRTLAPALVLEEARAADKRRAYGKKIGMLNGLPIPVKDSVNTTKYPTSNGTACLRNFVPQANAPCVNRLLDEGAFVMGKTNLHELSLGWSSVNAAFGAVRNPYDISRVSGGSSGGSAAAVAARIAPAAIAEDTLGSIRVPSSMCGICGLRPTHGRYPNGGVMPLAQNLDQIGMVARTVEDLLLFDSIFTGDHTALEAVDLRNVRLGFADFFFRDVHPEVERVVMAALDRLRVAGVTIVEADVDADIKISPGAASVLAFHEFRLAIPEFFATESEHISFNEILAQLEPDHRALFTMQGVPQALYEAALKQRARTSNAVRTHFKNYHLDALVLPTAMIPPFRLDEDGSMTVAGQVLPISLTAGRNMSVSSLASLSSLVLPAGLTSDGLPIGIEFDALSGSDRHLLAIGIAVQQALGPVPEPPLA